MCLYNRDFSAGLGAYYDITLGGRAIEEGSYEGQRFTPRTRSGHYGVIELPNLSRVYRLSPTFAKRATVGLGRTVYRPGSLCGRVLYLSACGFTSRQIKRTMDKLFFLSSYATTQHCEEKTQPADYEM